MKVEAFLWGVVMGSGIIALLWSDHEHRNPCLDRLQTTTWSIPAEGQCEVLLPHGRKRCAYPEIKMEGH